MGLSVWCWETDGKAWSWAPPGPSIPKTHSSAELMHSGVVWDLTGKIQTNTMELKGGRSRKDQAWVSRVLTQKVVSTSVQLMARVILGPDSWV